MVVILASCEREKKWYRGLGILTAISESHNYVRRDGLWKVLLQQFGQGLSTRTAHFRETHCRLTTNPLFLAIGYHVRPFTFNDRHQRWYDVFRFRSDFGKC